LSAFNSVRNNRLLVSPSRLYRATPVCILFIVAFYDRWPPNNPVATFLWTSASNDVIFAAGATRQRFST